MAFVHAQTLPDSNPLRAGSNFLAELPVSDFAPKMRVLD